MQTLKKLRDLKIFYWVGSKARILGSVPSISNTVYTFVTPAFCQLFCKDKIPNKACKTALHKLFTIARKVTQNTYPLDRLSKDYKK